MKTYFNENGININDAMFSAPDGAQYPIRNISSVAIVNWGGKIALGVGCLFLLTGVVTAGSSGFAGVPTLVLSGLAFLVYYFTRKTSLVFSASGKEMRAITFKRREVDKHAILFRARDALAQAISDIQRGKSEP